MEFVYSSTVLETLGSDFDEYVYLPANGTRGGILLAWKSRDVTITDPMFTTNTISARVKTPGSTSLPWWLSIVYGPQDNNAKIAFLQEIRDVRDACPGPWLICGDFNMIYRDEDKNNDNLNRRMMGRFRHVLNDLALKEIYLSGWRFTWSNEQNPPTLVHLDRVLCSTDWEERRGDATCVAWPRSSRITPPSCSTARHSQQRVDDSTSRSTGLVSPVSRRS